VDDVDGGAIKAKPVLEIHFGSARFLGRPMFSEQNSNSDKHKMERYLVHGRYTVASFYGPAVYAPNQRYYFIRMLASLRLVVKSALTPTGLFLNALNA
jgi:hypothetical protein